MTTFADVLGYPVSTETWAESEYTELFVDKILSIDNFNKLFPNTICEYSQYTVLLKSHLFGIFKSNKNEKLNIKNSVIIINISKKILIYSPRKNYFIYYNNSDPNKLILAEHNSNIEDLNKLTQGIGRKIDDDIYHEFFQYLENFLNSSIKQYTRGMLQFTVIHDCLSYHYYFGEITDSYIKNYDETLTFNGISFIYTYKKKLTLEYFGTNPTMSDFINLGGDKGKEISNSGLFCHLKRLKTAYKEMNDLIKIMLYNFIKLPPIIV